MPTTPRGLVYPASTAAPDVPADMQALAESIEAVWDGQPYCVVHNASAQSLTSGTIAVLTQDTDDSDVLAMHSTATNTSRIVAPSAGLYIAYATLNFAAHATGVRIGNIRKNAAGSSVGGTSLGYVELATSGTITYVQVMGLTYLAATDYVEVFGYQNSGGALGCTTTNFTLARFA